MNVLWVSPTPSHPQNAGNRAHIYSMAKVLMAAGHELTFLYYDQEKANDSAKKEMAEFWNKFVCIPHASEKRAKTLRENWAVDDWCSEDLLAAVRFLKNQNHYDVVYCEYVFLSKVLAQFPGNVLKILSTHDRMSDRAEMLRRQGLPPDFFYTTKSEEKKALERADLVLAIQEEEKIFFETLARKPTLSLGYPIEMDVISMPGRVEKLRVGFIGSNNSLNRKSLRSFINSVKQNELLSRQVQIVVAGNICNYIDDADVLCLGVVAEEKNFYQSIDLAVNPMIDGTGLKIKTLSAIRHGFPFISTKSGTAGLPVSQSSHACTSLDDLVQNLMEIIQTPEKMLRLLRQESIRLADSYVMNNERQILELLRAIETKSVKHIRRKSVLLITDVPFWEAGVGSHARILSLCLELQNACNLTIFFLGSIWPEREKKILEAGVTSVVVTYKDFEAASGVGIKLTCPDIPSLKKWRHESYARALRRFLMESHKFDLAIIEYIWLAYLIDVLPKETVSVIDIHDVMSYREHNFALKKANASISISLADELSLLERFNIVMAIQYLEAELLAGMLRRAITICVPHPGQVVDIDAMNFGKDEKKLRLGFGGALNDANSTALSWFLSNVWPIVRPLGIELHVFGGVCSSFKHKSDEAIILHGIVEDLSGVYGRIDVAINPVMFGGGIKIKSVEALGFGKPLIASPEGVVGIRCTNGVGVFIASTPSEFIDAIILLRHNRALLEKMSLDAKSLAVNQFSRNACFAPLVELIEAM